MSAETAEPQAAPDDATKRLKDLEHFKNMFALYSDEQAKQFLESLCPCKVNELAFDFDVDAWKIQADHMGALDDEISTEYLREQENQHTLSALLDGSIPYDEKDPFNAVTPDEWIAHAKMLGRSKREAMDEAKLEYPYPFDLVKQVLREYQCLVEMTQANPAARLETVLINAGKEVVEYLNYAQKLVQGPKKKSAHYWLHQGQGSLLPEGLQQLQKSMRFVIDMPNDK